MKKFLTFRIKLDTAFALDIHRSKRGMMLTVLAPILWVLAKVILHLKEGGKLVFWN